MKSGRTLAAICVCAVVGYWLWSEFLSREARIESLHKACMAEFVAGKTEAKPQADRSAPDPKSSDPATTIAKGLADRFGRLVESMAGSVGDAVCGTVRDACIKDFEGRLCVAARERYRK